MSAAMPDTMLDPGGDERPLDTGAQALADGLAQQVARWAQARGAGAAELRAVRHATLHLSLATSAGHVCLSLHDLTAFPAAEDGLPADGARWRAALLASQVVGTPDTVPALPLVLDADGRLYLQRQFDQERRLAARLLQAAVPAAAARGPAQAAADDATLRARLDALFAPDAARAGAPADASAPALDWQKLAAALALQRRLTIISGGPGTGKTTTVVNLLACLLANEPNLRVALAAPTGKAAARMTEAIRQRAGHLPAELRARLPAAASTVHRLLGARPDGSVAYHAGRPLAIDALVVDEASMLDLALATRLLDAVPPTARIVLLGDKDQLAAVEAGAVFSELSTEVSFSAEGIAALAALTGAPADAIRAPAPPLSDALPGGSPEDPPAAVLPDSVVWLDRNFRFGRDSGIGRLAALVNAGMAREALDWLAAGAQPELRWIDDGGTPALSPAALKCIDEALTGYLEALRRDPGDRVGVSDAFARFRVLCAVRDGPRGVDGVNALLERRVRAALGVPAGQRGGYSGRPVLVRRNDPLLGLFNGDVGITLPDERGAAMVWFPDAAGGFRAIAPARLPPHDTAFALTVHQAQGSEFDQVLVLLPAQRARVLTRELLYTALTRARRHVTLAAGAGAIEAAISTATRRRSGLLARLREARADVPRSSM